MTEISETPARYDRIARALHWGMAILFVAQFTAAAAHWALPREDEFRQLVWGYHADVGITIFLLFFVRGAWGLATLNRRPPLHSGLIGRLALAGHMSIYALMMIVPFARILAAAGGKRGLTYFDIQIFPGRDTAIGWTQALAEWHGEMGWTLGLLILGHIGMAIVWHHFIQRDDTLKRMIG